MQAAAAANKNGKVKKEEALKEGFKLLLFEDKMKQISIPLSNFCQFPLNDFKMSTSISHTYDQCDQIGQFIGLWATF